jgi:hypothetical protein
VFYLLKLLDEPSDAMNAVSDILPNLKSLSSKFLLICMVGHREGTGHGLVNEDDASTLEQDITGQIIQATSERLSTEWDVLRLLSTTSYWGIRQSPSVSDFSSSPLHRAILLKSRSNVRSQMVGNRAVHITPTLYWDTLERIYGDDASIRRAVDVAEQSVSGDDDELVPVLALARKYIDGWRPETFRSTDTARD